jgi:serine/threonine protein kinase
VHQGKANDLVSRPQTTVLLTLCLSIGILLCIHDIVLQADLAALAQEGDFYERLSTHHNIVNMVWSTSIPETREVRLFLQYYSTNLAQLFDLRLGRDAPIPFTLQEVAFAGLELAQGLQAIHDERIVHLDLKPANVFCQTKKQRVRGARVKTCTRHLIGDFDVSKQLPSVRRQRSRPGGSSGGSGSLDGSLGGSSSGGGRTFLAASTATGVGKWSGQGGTNGFIPPECLAGEELPAYSKSFDIFSLGVILWMMVCSEQSPPMPSGNSADDSSLYDLPPDVAETVLGTVISSCLSQKPQDRLTAEQVVAQLEPVYEQFLEGEFLGGQSEEG